MASPICCRASLSRRPVSILSQIHPTPTPTGRAFSSQCSRATAPPCNSSSSVKGRRALHTTPHPQISLKEILKKTGIANTTGRSYFIYQATEQLRKACGAQADYTIDPADRKASKLKKASDGEEIGRSGGEGSKAPSVWHEEMGLLPTFSTWSQVTMLHMYLLVVRFRDMPKLQQTSFQDGLVNHFFYEAEAKMDLVHDLGSRVIRQKYLKDLFVQWRGLVLAYDEALAKDSDAVLASAIWRNLYKADEDVDARKLAAVVSYVRKGMVDLAHLREEDLVIRGKGLFDGAKGWVSVKEELRGVDVPSAQVKALFDKQGLSSEPVKEGSRFSSP
ncbi:ubiquinol-cytochrome C chaperone-domain-containing protein [Triangularia verruculosa]|uniref:Ubiquinol-cytochrome C chaperone-domain-containing protein n=1 Tax=Triangularia verruculosa TaxID=2587418 RepID=A0AAN6XS10_9PEZI|nr:ubiquinol-cytochrome C chaperone-domain-containing protein [Triangularia verruculosa]